MRPETRPGLRSDARPDAPSLDGPSLDGPSTAVAPGPAGTRLVAGAPSQLAEAGGFLRHVGNFLGGQVGVGLLELAAAAVFARALTVQAFGHYALFSAGVAIVTVLFELNQRGALVRYYLEDRDDFPDFLRSVLAITAVAAGAGAALVGLFSEPIAAWLALPVGLVGWIVVASVAQVPWNLRWKLFVAEQRSARYAQLSIARAALVLCGATALLWGDARRRGLPLWHPASDSGRAELLAGSVALIWLALGLVLLAGLWRRSANARVTRAHLRYGLAFGLPLIPHALAGHILSLFDRVVLNQVAGGAAVGLYAFAYNLGLAMGAAVTAMNQAWLPVFMRLRRAGDTDGIARLVGQHARLVGLAAGVVVLFARDLAWVLGDARYHAALPIVPVVVFSYALTFVATTYANYAFYLRRTATISLATLLAGVLNIALNYAFIPAYGYAAAAWTTLVAYAALAALHHASARFFHREHVAPLRRLAGPLLLSAACAAAYAQAEAWAVAQLFAPGKPLAGGAWLLLAVKLSGVAVAAALYWRRRRG